MMENHGHVVGSTALKALVVFAVVVSGLLGLLFLYAIRVVLLQLLIATILAIALTPLVERLTTRGINRTLACVITVLTTVLLLAGIVSAIASPLIMQGGALVENAPKLIKKAISNPIIKQYGEQYGLIEQVERLAESLPGLLIGGGAPLLGALGSIVTTVSSIAIILVLTLFLLMEGVTAWTRLLNLLDRTHAVIIRTIAEKVAVAVGGFVNGNLLISLIAGLFALAILLIFDIPYALALAALVAILDLIPLVGASIAAIIVALVALGNGITVALAVLGIFLVYQFIEGNFIQPTIYGRTVQLSRLLIITATIVGAQLGGVVGVLLAIPAAAALQILVIEGLKLSGADLKPKVANSIKK